MAGRLFWALPLATIAALLPAGPAWCQSTSAETPAATSRDVVVIDVAEARQWVILAELEFLADPVTFPYRLKAHAGPAGLEVHGYVPNDLVRNRAIELAKRVCPITVVDRLRRVPRSVPLPTPLPDRFLSRVRSRLASIDPRHVDQLEVTADSDGRVTLIGTAPTLEAKLAYSRCLRDLPGCTSVNNQLAVANEPAQTVAVDLPTEPKPGVDKATRKTLFTDIRSPLAWLLPGRKERSAKPVRPPVPRSPTEPDNGTARQNAADRQGVPVIVHFDSAQKPDSVIQQTSATTPAAAKTVRERSPAPVEPTVQPQKKPRRRLFFFPTPRAVMRPQKLTPPEAVQRSIRQRLVTALPGVVRDVELTFDGKGGVKVVLDVAGGTDLSSIVPYVFQVPELAAYHVDLQFRVY